MSEKSHVPHDQRVNFDDFPHIDYDGKRFVLEIEFQLFDNPAWTEAERQWWAYIRGRFLSCTESYEMLIQQAFNKGAEYGNAAAGLEDIA